MSKNPKNRWKSMKIATIDRKSLHIFWTTRGIWMKFSGKMWLIIILKVTKNQGFTLITLSLEDAFFEKPQRGGRVKLTTTPAVLGLKVLKQKWKYLTKISTWIRYVFICILEFSLVVIQYKASSKLIIKPQRIAVFISFSY